MAEVPVQWGPRLPFNSLFDPRHDPDIIQLSNGNILACWTTADSTGEGSPPGLDVMGRFFDPAGNPIGGEFRLNKDFFSDQEQDIDLANLPGGGFLSVYEDTDLSGTGIRLEEYDITGASIAHNNCEP